MSAEQRPGSAALAVAVRHYARQIRRDARVSIPGLILPGIGNILVFYVPPLVVARMLARFAEGAEPPLIELVTAVAFMAGVWMAGELTWRVGIHLINRAELRGIERLYNDALGYLQQRDLSFFHDNFAGSLTKRSLAYAKSYEGVFDILVFSIVSELLPLAFVIPVLWRFSPWLIVVLLGMVTLTAMLVVPLIRRRQRLVDAREEASNVLAGHVADTIANADAVRAFAREDHEATVHARNVGDWGQKALRSWDFQNRRIDLFTSPMYVMTNALGLLVALAVGRGGAFGVEAAFVTFSYFAMFSRLMWEFNHIYRNIEAHLTEAAQFTELLLDPPKVVDAAHPEPFAPDDAGIEFRGVRFHYLDRGDRELFDHLDLRIASGEKIGLVGRSGGGKTTLTKLLLRFVDIQAGQILIGGRDVARVPQRELRDYIATVPQDPLMFHRSIADNIRFGRLDATDDEVRDAARAAHAAVFIDELPHGFDTLIGERGVKLSGGQRQRVAIARAILKDAPILVLDEATSSLDSESEQLIQDALWRLMHGRTAIVIAHRLSTVRRMDRLVVLEEGAIVEQGSHDELLARGGVYATLWEHQSGGFLSEGTAVSA